MRQALDTKREGILAGFIFALWLMTVVFPLLQINIFTPAGELTPLLYWLAAVYLVLNSFAFVYSIYMLVVLYRASMRRKAPSNVRWRMALYLYAIAGLSIAIYTAVQLMM